MNSDFIKDKLNNFQIDEDVYITADIKYIGENYGIIFHVYSFMDNFKDITIQSLKLKDESGVLFETKDKINVLVTDSTSFFDSTNNLYQRSFLFSDYHLSQEEIQQNKKFYSLEYFIKGKKRIEKLIRKEGRKVFNN